MPESGGMMGALPFQKGAMWWRFLFMSVGRGGRLGPPRF